ncbi:MAG: PDZ domain-containing protein, partial [Oscillospiraceae bacterium]|nr:PDZ domain-containing protein [Oscillospiraceae bacterium]
MKGRKNMNKNSLIYGILETFAVAGMTYAITYNYYKKDIEFAESNRELIKVIDDVKENFYKDVNEEDMTYNMISGLINGLDDRFTYYYNSNMSNEKYVNESITLKSSGFQIDKDKTGNILITNVKPDSQAEKMNLRKNDIITAVNGVKVTDSGYYNIISELMGKDGTSMKLDVLRDGESFEIDFIRSNFLEMYSNVLYKAINEDTLYYRFNIFDESTVDNFNYAVEENQNIKNVIFDLRNNSGGIIDECIKFFDLFAGEGNQVREVCS